MSVAHDTGHGPYSAQDLHALPEEGKRYELADGWLVELSPRTRHSGVANELHQILHRAAASAGADVRLAVEPEISTVSGIRKPDVAAVDGRRARAAMERDDWTYEASDLLLAVEVVSRGSGSEREDRIHKVTEYAASGIPQYWVLDYEPAANVRMYRLNGSTYDVLDDVPEGRKLAVDTPFAVEFDPADLCEWRR